MNWSKSYTASWRVFRVNRDTWADAELIKNVDSANISRTADGAMLESGSLELTGDFQPDYYRIVMTAEQGGEVLRVDVATLLFSVSGGDINHGATISKADGYSVLYPASVTTVITGEYAPAGCNGAEYAAELLESAINAPVQVKGSFILNEHIVHKIGSSVLEAVWAVLDAGGFVMQIDGRGVVHIKPKPTEPDLIIDSNSTRILMNDISYTTDISEVPNRYIVIDDTSRTIAVNNAPESEISTVNRGFCVDMVDESPKPINGETYAIYAERRLRELSVVKEEKSYTREFANGVLLYSIVRASIPGLEGDLRVEAQTINCDKGITVQEKASKETQLW